jgi:ubiquinone/menaquinone biosynthesis C-methylase UbiE
MAKDFYADVVGKSGVAADDKVVVVCGGNYDRTVLESAGVKDATITNVDYHGGVQNYAPYSWQFQDAENLTIADDSFDWAFVHAGLHHCGSPHKALCEMLRVSRKGVLVIEARDSAMMRLAVRLGFTPDFETEAAILSDGKFGGYRNTIIPNYVYRWTERDVEKTVTTFLPQYEHTIRYFYGLRIPTQRMAMSTSPPKRAAVKLLDKATWIMEKLLPKQGNCFGFIITKNDGLKPWIINGKDGLALDLDYLRRNYDPSKYVGGKK